ncbi:protocadherin Fat 1 [Caerostris extrusa]|uniref:Protocadherin Fat 1 n=1 Tax=Caerostris extrusa TaxID=172846 RepID=A0AAV4MD41_CAEEX|nr:protocadherin Fat 1 [Caerostris extrusa]
MTVLPSLGKHTTLPFCYCQPTKGVHVINVIATDMDSFSSIRYSIASGNIDKKFLINETMGDITVLDPMGLSRKYTLVVTASDGEFETSTKSCCQDTGKPAEWSAI